MTVKERNKAIEYLKGIQNRYINIKDDKIVVNETLEFWLLEVIIRELKKETVSKQAYDHEHLLRKTFETRIDELERRIETLKRKSPTGKWRKEYTGCMYDVCSECGQKVTSGYFEFNYCPNCGAYMKEREDK